MVTIAQLGQLPVALLVVEAMLAVVVAALLVWAANPTLIAARPRTARADWQPDVADSSSIRRLRSPDAESSGAAAAAESAIQQAIRNAASRAGLAGARSARSVSDTGALPPPDRIDVYSDDSGAVAEPLHVPASSVTTTPAGLTDSSGAAVPEGARLINMDAVVEQMLRELPERIRLHADGRLSFRFRFHDPMHSSEP